MQSEEVMGDRATRDHLLRDPLAPETRKSRTFLLGLSVAAIAMVKAGITPTKISALGVEFGRTDQKAILGLLAAVTLYFLVAFAILASADFVAWRRAGQRGALDAAMEALLLERESGISLEDQQRTALLVGYEAGESAGAAGWVVLVRIAFEFLLPGAVGAYALLVVGSSLARI